MKAFYNEIDRYCCAWISNLMDAGHITPGKIDDRSIEDIHPSDLVGYNRVHFFAGIAVWDYALNLAGWGEREVWTGSCPCQPFSIAGKRKGTADKRHLWPEFFRLIKECKPGAVFGEQVASKDGYAWLDLVQTDLESLGYAVGPVVLPAAGFGAPHGRHRIYFVADADKQQWNGERNPGATGRQEFANGCASRGLSDDDSKRPQGWLSGRSDSQREIEHGQAGSGGATGRMADAFDGQFQEKGRQPVGRIGQSGAGTQCSPACSDNSQWRDADWLLCRDGKWRPVEPGTFPLANGVAARMGKLRAYGNSIVAPQAQAFIEAYLDIQAEA